MRVYELTPGRYDRAKSFCKIDKSGEFVRMWSGYSATTIRRTRSRWRKAHAPLI